MATSRFAANLNFIGRRRTADALLQLEIDLQEGRKRAGTPLHEYRERAEGSLIEFVKLMWPVLEPRPFVNGWAIGAMAEHLEAITRGQIRKLLINVPPGCCKSMLTGVFWPAWEWGPKRRADLRTLSVSYSDDNPKRDIRNLKLLVESASYRQLWGDSFKLIKKAEDHLSTDRTGFMFASHVGGATGQRGDRVRIDDPHQIDGAESEAVRLRGLRWFTETATMRVNDALSSMFVVMQRLHEKDISGLILSKELGFEHLCLPMYYESNHPGNKTTSIGFKDPRKKEGELLWPERFPADFLRDDVEKRLAATGGEYAIASQLQQRPVPREGGDFKEKDFVRVDTAPDKMVVVRGWDLAGSKDKTSPWTVGVKMGMTRGPKPRFFVLHVKRVRGLPHEVEDCIRDVTHADGHHVIQDLPQDPGQAGKGQVLSFTAMLAGFQVFSSPETGDKRLRARTLAAQVGGGNVSVLQAEWTDTYIAELAAFPNGTWSDQVDASSRAFARLTLLRQGEQPVDVPAGVVT